METLPALTQQTAVAMRDPDADAFALVQRKARMYATSTLVPDTFRGEANLGNCVIALEMANRLGAGVLPVMQSIYIVHGKPAWSSQFVISCLNTCGRFEPLRFDVAGDGDNRTCTAWTVDRGQRLPAGAGTLTEAKEAGIPVYEGPGVSIEMAKKEGWYSKNGSKWQTIPELMLRYRAATFFGRLYAPELLMGMSTREEAHETIDVEAEPVRPKFEGPAEPSPKKETPPADPPADNRPPYEILKERCADAEITEAELCAYLVDHKWMQKDQDPSAKKCEGAMRKVLSAWEVVKAAIEGRRTA